MKNISSYFEFLIFWIWKWKKSGGAFYKEKYKVNWQQVSKMNGHKKITSEIEFDKSTKNCVCKLWSTFRIMFLNLKLGRLNNISTSTEHNIIKTLKESGEISTRKWQSTLWSLGKVENCSVIRWLEMWNSFWKVLWTKDKRKHPVSHLC